MTNDFNLKLKQYTYNYLIEGLIIIKFAIQFLLIKVFYFYLFILAL